jgi:hypothetical protein
MRCEALTKKGARCNGGAMPFARFCGPHMDNSPRGEATGKETEVMSQYHTVKVDGALYVPLSHWETVVADRDKWKKLYEELLKETEDKNDD